MAQAAAVNATTLNPVAQQQLAQATSYTAPAATDDLEYLVHAALAQASFHEDTEVTPTCDDVLDILAFKFQKYSNSQSDSKCFYCKAPGHAWRNCFKLRSILQRNGLPPGVQILTSYRPNNNRQYSPGNNNHRYNNQRNSPQQHHNHRNGRNHNHRGNHHNGSTHNNQNHGKHHGHGNQNNNHQKSAPVNNLEADDYSDGAYSSCGSNCEKCNSLNS